MFENLWIIWANMLGLTLVAIYEGYLDFRYPFGRIPKWALISFDLLLFILLGLIIISLRKSG